VIGTKARVGATRTDGAARIFPPTTEDDDHMPARDENAVAPVEPRGAAAVIDVFVYVVVLNLFGQYLPTVVSETFTLSLLTAVVLKGVIEVVLVAKKLVVARFRRASRPIGKVVAAIMV